MLFWVFMLGNLVWREYVAPKQSLFLWDSEVEEIQESKDWMGIYSQGRKIGFATSQVTRVDGGFLIEERSTLRLSLLGIPRKVRTGADIVTDPQFRLRSFRMDVSSGPVKFRVDGEVQGKELDLTILSADRTRKQTIPLEEVPWLSQNLRYLLVQNQLRVGRRFRAPMFDPMTMSQSTMEIRVEEKEFWDIDGASRPVFRLSHNWKGLKSTSWVSESGETLKEEGFGGMTLVRESPDEFLTKGWEEKAALGPDLIRSASIPVGTRIASPRTLTRLKLRFQRVDMSPFAMDEPRQKTSGRIVIVRKEDLSTAESYTLPYEGGTEFEKLLAPTPLIQSDDPEIKQTADDIVGSNKDAVQAVKRLMNWTYDNIEKVPTVSIPSAVEVLRTRQGDCNEHAVLFAALSRAAGAPTKLCAGLLYMDGGFYYHAWNEVYLGGWFTVDSLMNQFPADPTHVKLVEGSLENQIQLVQLIGKVGVDIVNYQ